MKKLSKYLFSSFWMFGFIFSGYLNGQVTREHSLLDAKSFDAKISTVSNAQLVDIRTPEEYEKGHLPEAVNTDWRSPDFEKKIQNLDKTMPVFVYCLSGGRSEAATAKMKAMGFQQIYELQGGIMKWRGANLPEVSSVHEQAKGMSVNDFQALLNSEKPVLIDFYADWCAPCQKMKPWLEEISVEMPDKVKVIRINVDENQALCKSMGIEGLPVLQLYKDKTMTWSHTGKIEKEAVLKQL